MRIRGFTFNGVRGLDGLKKDLPGSDNDLVVVFGKQGSGKTTFLDTLAAAKEAIAEYGSPDSRWDSIPDSRGIAKVTINWEASANEQARFALGNPQLQTESFLGRRTGDPAEYPVSIVGMLGEVGEAERGSVHYFHDSRALEGPIDFGADDAALRNRLTTRNSKFAELYDLLDQPEYATAKALASDRYSELFPRLGLAGMRRYGMSFHIMVQDKEKGEQRTYDTLSTSERQGLIMALYTARRPIVDSIILIDAPERGFGDGATDLLRGLLRWTTRTQLIVATASGAVRSMPEASHVVELPSS
ncbi:MAG: hypothetical protein JNL21_00735 [Myxococcales bacterium]|nr:hypothetical protein [Myxococcales bacterium]